MRFIADIHVHSHFSRATAKNLNLEHLYTAARLKGVTLVGTGDFTHPGWMAELEEKLSPAEPGLFRLKKNIELKLDKSIPPLCRKDVRFILQTEISSIYKKDGRVRKNHNLLYFPDMELVKKFNARLERIGNIKSDGRPILGLDAGKLLELMLETSQQAFLIPAHIWTPWFSMFGSKSGFDTIEECFGSLACHIFAVETGLSSNPPMNWRVKDLDNVRLISNSDAHSPGYLGRNASVFDTELSYEALRYALESNDSGKFVGTIDMYPEEGKYHFDGHRKCNICFTPEQTLENNGICPVCGKPLTLGVLHRVQELALRPAGYVPENRHGYKSIIPLNDILSEILGVGPKTKKVALHYNRAVELLGSELEILLDRDISNIEDTGIPLLSEAISRMRKGDIKIAPGFDGEYGKVKIFDDKERDALKGERDIFSVPSGKSFSSFGKNRNNSFFSSGKQRNCEVATGDDKSLYGRGITAKKQVKIQGSKEFLKVRNDKNNVSTGYNLGDEYNGGDSHRKTSGTGIEDNLLSCLNKEQKKAVCAFGHPVIIEAGPGTGKTRTLTTKIAWLIKEKNVDPGSILALTFTNRAAKEMKQRISDLLASSGMEEEPGINGTVYTATFHSFCLMVLKKYASFSFLIADDTTRKELIARAFKETMAVDSHKRGDSTLSVKKTDQMVANAKQHCLSFSDNLDFIAKCPDDAARLSEVWQRYQELLLFQNAVDFEDIIVMALDLFKFREEVLLKIRHRFPYVFIDEYQDINKAQYLLVKTLADNGKNLFVIGDPDQSIYGFRGSDNRYFRKFLSDYPDAEKIGLKQSYRSTHIIIDASFQMITHMKSPAENIGGPYDKSTNNARTKVFSDIKGRDRIMIIKAASEKAEAVAVGKAIEKLTGGISLFSMDTGKADASDHREFSFSDFAVLYRTKNQGRIFARVFENAGIPFQMADREDLFLRKGIKELISIAKTISGTGTINDFITAIEAFFATCDNDSGDCGNNPGKKIKEILNGWLYSLDSFPGNVLETLSEPLENFPLDIKSRYKKSISKSASALLKLKNIIANPEKEKSRCLNVSDFMKIAADMSGIISIINQDEKTKEIFNLLLKDAEQFADAENFQGSLREFMEFLALKEDTETIRDKAEKVTFMTMHASKGLEFPVVFVTGCESGLIPFTLHDKDRTDTEEERRLFYVAMTRAKKILYLTYAEKRMIYGKIVKLKRSPFLDDIEKELKNHIENKAKKNKKQKKTGMAKQLDLFGFQHDIK